MVLHFKMIFLLLQYILAMEKIFLLVELQSDVSIGMLEKS
jgi:hypothetical protein